MTWKPRGSACLMPGMPHCVSVQRLIFCQRHGETMDTRTQKLSNASFK